MIKIVSAGLLAALMIAGNVSAQTYVRYEQNGMASWGELKGDTIDQLSGAPYLEGKSTGKSVKRVDVKLLAPVEPKLVFMTALNFKSHIGDREPAKYPGLFTVPAHSIIGPEDNIVRPAESKNLHYEAEMVVVVGKHAKNVPLEKAGDYIFGVTAGNDVSERDWQRNDIQWLRAKGTDGFNAVGPVLVKGLDYTNLEIEGRLNGERVQGQNSSDMLFDMNYMVYYISKYFTLEPGDLIWSGTMGSTKKMEPGDVYEVDVEGVGVLSNKVEQGK
ncbi:MAG: fumarylacetoacetate hydrolase family protein [Kordiimonadaceae bacterium]|nr:fumarylacetoacetate hydrolase family protein [Kordiimonadaceae bacterium]